VHTDARTLDAGTLIEGDVCIIGAGAAGISIALEWLTGPRKVILLEGGGFEVEPKMQDLYRGEIVGQPYFPLEAARLHCFGGTTGHWAGWCSTYDAIDFEQRPWVPNSGWPIRREELDPFYTRAQPLLDLGAYDYDSASYVKQDAALTPLALGSETFWTKMWQFSPPTRFGKKYRDAIVRSPNVHLYTYANVVELAANEAMSAVDELRVRTITGKEHRVRAKTYVMACCSIQNARLLLASNRQATAGLANAHDVVGRYFMEHLEMPGGALMLAKPESTRMKMYAMDFGVTKARGEIALTPQAQRAHKVLNGTLSLEPAPFEQPGRSTFQFMPPEKVEALRRWDEGGRHGPNPLGSEGGVPADSSGRPPSYYQLATRMEQSPNPDSRVTLSTEKDALGMPRVRLDWRLTALEKRSIRVLHELLGHEVGRTGIGRLQFREWLLDADEVWPPFVGGGWHHMGTTRMSTDPKKGVVDPDCRVHGLANLYIAGASVYPTAGAANPTLTLVSLSLRLSDHLKGQVA
jgi:choline dehydrogenase-like flavoprotein